MMFGKMFLRQFVINLVCFTLEADVPILQNLEDLLNF